MTQASLKAIVIASRKDTNLTYICAFSGDSMPV